MILALLNGFVYDYRGNNTYVIQEKTALPYAHMLVLRNLDGLGYRHTAATAFTTLIIDTI